MKVQICLCSADFTSFGCIPSSWVAEYVVALYLIFIGGTCLESAV
jgi:hypothetical protein